MELIARQDRRDQGGRRFRAGGYRRTPLPPLCYLPASGHVKKSKSHRYTLNGTPRWMGLDAGEKTRPAPFQSPFANPSARRGPFAVIEMNAPAAREPPAQEVHGRDGEEDDVDPSQRRDEPVGDPRRRERVATDDPGGQRDHDHDRDRKRIAPKRREAGREIDANTWWPLGARHAGQARLPPRGGLRSTGCRRGAP